MLGFLKGRKSSPPPDSRNQGNGGASAAPPSLSSLTPAKVTSLSSFQGKAPTEWAVEEVAAWLDFIGLPEYSELFKHHSISGQELVELTDADLVSLEVEKIGHRRKILSRVKSLTRRKDEDDVSSEGSSRSGRSGSEISFGSNSNSTSSFTGSAYSRELDEVVFKCYLEDDIRIVKINKNAPFQTLEEKIEKEYGRQVVIKYKDEDGDLVTLKTNAGLQGLISSTATSEIVRLYLTSQKKVHASSSSSSTSSRSIKQDESSVLENFVDGVIVIDKKGVIVFFNKAAEKMFGYSRNEVVSHNVRCLMAPDIAKHHNHYIRRYLRTGQSRVLGLGRKLEAKRKDGKLIPVWLSVSENKIGKHQHTFTATVQDLSHAMEDSTTITDISESEFRKAVELLDELLTVAFVFSDTGVIQYVNKKATQELGISNETAVGKRKITSVLTSLATEEHDLFASEGKLLDGLKKEIVVDKADGTAIPYALTITKTNLRHRRFFTALLQGTSTAAPTKSFLQEEREVISNLAVAGIIVDEKGTIQEMNKASQALFGYNTSQVLGRNVAILIAEREVAQKHNDFIKGYLETGQSKIIGTTREALAMARDGSFIPVKLSVTAKRRDGRVLFTGLFLPVS